MTPVVRRASRMLTPDGGAVHVPLVVEVRLLFEPPLICHKVRFWNYKLTMS